MIYVGTSGFSYKQWSGIFYPEGLGARDYLAFYSRRFPTTEINNTFYRTPSARTCGVWADQVGEDFRFALKLTRRITHQKKLRDVDQEMNWFFTGAGALGSNLACILVQLPPWLRKDLTLLEDFLQNYASQSRLAFEFRHESWMGQETCELLHRFKAALVIVETDSRPPVREVTAPFVYVRLRKSSYLEPELEEWARWLTNFSKESFVYLKHEKSAPLLARQLLEMVRAEPRYWDHSPP
ncbi:MAG: DUF72 domain-containing protein [Acidobacteriota bacterium]